MAKIQEVTEKEFERVGAHSHITGLGLKNKKAQKKAAGMVGQANAREAAGIVVEMIKSGKLGGRAVMLAGPPGTGKTAIAVGMARELGNDVPFVQIAGSEIYSSETPKTEFLTQTLRKSLGVRIREVREIFEGEIINLKVEQDSHPFNPYQKLPASAVIELKTRDDSKKIKVGKEIAMGLIQKGVGKGDVVQIDAESGRVVPVGKSKRSRSSKGADYSIESTVEVPSGEVKKEKEFVYVLTLHGLDIANSKRGGGSLIDIFIGGLKKPEITSEIRTAVDNFVKKQVTEGEAEIIPGVLFIDEVHMLDIESFSFLNRAMESELAPIMIFATNRGITKIRGTELQAPHGMPLDLLDRLLIISTRNYEKDEIHEILNIRAKEEDCEIDKEALEYLTDIGGKTSLRYAVQLLAPSKSLAGSKIKIDHVKQAEKLFVDVKKSVSHLKKYEKDMLS